MLRTSLTLSQRSADQYNTLVEARKDAAATPPLVSKGKEDRHSNNARIVDPQKRNERLTGEFNIHKTKGARKQSQEEKPKVIYKQYTRNVSSNLLSIILGKVRVNSKQLTSARLGK